MASENTSWGGSGVRATTGSPVSQDAVTGSERLLLRASMSTPWTA
jgi:hypothetical protein